MKNHSWCGFYGNFILSFVFGFCFINVIHTLTHVDHKIITTIIRGRKMCKVPSVLERVGWRRAITFIEIKRELNKKQWAMSDQQLSAKYTINHCYKDNELIERIWTVPWNFNAVYVRTCIWHTCDKHISYKLIILWLFKYKRWREGEKSTIWRNYYSNSYILSQFVQKRQKKRTYQI